MFVAVVLVSSLVDTTESWIRSHPGTSIAHFELCGKNLKFYFPKETKTKNYLGYDFFFSVVLFFVFNVK